MPNHLYTYIYIYIYIKREREREREFGLVGFYGISTIVGYLMPNHLYTYIYIKYKGFDVVGLGFMAYQIL